MSVYFDIINNKYIHILLRLLLGGIFIYASFDKIAFPDKFANIVVNFHILPDEIAYYFAYILPYIELFLGILIIVGAYVRESAGILSALLIIFMIAIIIKSNHGRIDDCGCFSFLSSEKKETNVISLLLRDAIFLFISLSVLFSKRAKE